MVSRFFAVAAMIVILGAFGFFSLRVALEEIKVAQEDLPIDEVLAFAKTTYEIKGEEGINDLCRDGWDHKVIEFEGLFFRCRANQTDLGYRIRIVQYSSMAEALPPRGVKGDEERLEYLHS